MAYETITEVQLLQYAKSLCPECRGNVIEINNIYHFGKFAETQWWHSNPKYMRKFIMRDKYELVYHPLHMRVKKLDKWDDDSPFRKELTDEQWDKQMNLVMPKFENFDFSLDIKEAIEQVTYNDFWGMCEDKSKLDSPRTQEEMEFNKSANSNQQSRAYRKQKTKDNQLYTTAFR